MKLIHMKMIIFWLDLPFGILSFNSYLDIRSMNIISSSVEIDKYKHLNIESLDFMYAFTKLEILDYLGFHKHLEEAGYDFIDLEFFGVYNELKT